jgi:hypothetical protein
VTKTYQSGFCLTNIRMEAQKTTRAEVIIDLIDKLFGDIKPVGDGVIDPNKQKALLEVGQVIDHLLNKIIDVSHVMKDYHQASIKDSAGVAQNMLENIVSKIITNYPCDITLPHTFTFKGLEDSIMTLVVDVNKCEYVADPLGMIDLIDNLLVNRICSLEAEDLLKEAKEEFNMGNLPYDLFKQKLIRLLESFLDKNSCSHAGERVIENYIIFINKKSETHNEREAYKG